MTETNETQFSHTLKILGMKFSFQLQDLKEDSQTKIDKWLQKWERPSFSARKDKSSSIAILFKKNTQFEVNKTSRDENGRFLLVNGTKDDTNVTLSNITHLLDLRNSMNEDCSLKNWKIQFLNFNLLTLNWFLGGDFNCVTDVDLDRSHTISKTDSSVNKLRNILSNFQLKDIWRQHNLATQPRQKRIYILFKCGNSQ